MSLNHLGICLVRFPKPGFTASFSFKGFFSSNLSNNMKGVRSEKILVVVMHANIDSWILQTSKFNHH